MMVIVTVLEKKGQDIDILKSLQTAIVCKNFCSALDMIEKYIEKNIDRSKYYPEFHKDKLILIDRNNKYNQLVFKLFEQAVLK